MSEADILKPAADALGLPYSLDSYYLPLVRPSAVTALGGVPFIDPGRLIRRDTVERFAAEIAPHYRGDMRRHDEVKALGLGLGYGDIEAVLYYAVVKSFKPDMIVEIGAGVSTYYAREATRGTDCRIICVEPYPADNFPDWCEKESIELWRRPLQEAVKDLTFTERSILFVDSTHVAKITSELHMVFIDLLPKLRPGNLVHFHDIFTPFPCLPGDHNAFAPTVNWYESVLLGIFLSASNDYETVFPEHWMGRNDALRPILEKTIPLYAETHTEGSSYWIRRR